MTTRISKIAVFCGSNHGNRPEYVDATNQLAASLCNADISLVYGGANVGLMGVLANQMLRLGGEVIGVLPENLVEWEVAHRGITKLHIVPTMHERKVMMMNLADGFIMLPGGAGSLDEFFEVITLAQLGLHKKPCGILNVAKYYDLLLSFLEHSVTEGFIKNGYRDLVMIDNHPEKLLQRFLKVDSISSSLVRQKEPLF